MGVLLLLVPRRAEVADRDTVVLSMALRAAGSCVALSAVLLAAHANPTGTARTLDNQATVQHFESGMSIASATAQTLPGLPLDADLVAAVRRSGCEQLTFTSRTLDRIVIIVEYRSRGPEYNGNAITSATTYLRSAAGRRPTTCLSDGN